MAEVCRITKMEKGRRIVIQCNTADDAQTLIDNLFEVFPMETYWQAYVPKGRKRVVHAEPGVSFEDVRGMVEEQIEMAAPMNDVWEE